MTVSCVRVHAFSTTGSRPIFKPSLPDIRSVRYNYWSIISEAECVLQVFKKYLHARHIEIQCSASKKRDPVNLGFRSSGHVVYLIRIIVDIVDDKTNLSMTGLSKVSN